MFAARLASVYCIIIVVLSNYGIYVPASSIKHFGNIVVSEQTQKRVIVISLELSHTDHTNYWFIYTNHKFFDALEKTKAVILKCTVYSQTIA